MYESESVAYVLFEWFDFGFFSDDMDEDEAISRHPSFRPHSVHRGTEEDPMGEAKLYSDHHHHHHYHPHQHHQAADR